ncbi:macrolide family glycosyltransferase [Streptomyces sp. NPDC000070]|uniref:macrolide family glycosyltransferase n=1 Tax=Streptomyces sp. NPDC000070 TaxID=3154240 RepID=UPI0033281395
MSIAGHGHVNPTLAVVEELIARGHAVDYVVAEEYADAVARAGARPLPYHFPDGATDPVQPDDEFGLPSMELLLETELALRAAEQRPGGSHGVDLVVYDGLAWAGRVLAAKWRLPGVELWPSFVSNAHFSLEAEFLGDRLITADMLGFARELPALLTRHGLPNISAGRFLRHGEGLRLVFLPRAFQYRGDTFDDTFAFVGPCLRDTHRGEGAHRQDGPPLLLVSLGTVYSEQPEFFRLCADALADLPWRVVLSGGGRVTADAVGVLPPHIEMHERVDQLDVLTRASAFVTHAGMGSVMEAVAHQVPMVAVPQMGEQRAVAERVAALDLGVRLDPDELTADGLRASVLRVAGDDRVRDGLRRMHRHAAEAGGAVTAVDRIEAYATQRQVSSLAVRRAPTGT